MKIAFVTPEYPHPATGSSGGIGTSIKNLAAELANQGAAISVIVYGQNADASFYNGEVEVHQLRSVRLRGLSWLLTRKKIERFVNAKIAEGQIEIIEAPDWNGITSFIKPKCPVVVKFHGSDTYFCDLEKRPVRPWNRFHERRAIKSADALVSVSRFTALHTLEIFKVNRQFTVLPNGVDTGRFPLSGTTRGNVIIYFGTLIRKKGMLELPAIFNLVHAANPGAKLILVGPDSNDILTGSDSTWNLMKPLFSATSLENVHYAGKIQYNEMRSAIDNADICVFPTFAEALPVSWIEAMAMGKAVVASNVGWASEVIDDAINGFLVHPANHVAFSARILDLLRDPGLRSRIGAAARERVLNLFDIKSVAAKHLEYYQKLLRK